MKICYNPIGKAAITAATALSDDLIFDLVAKRIWAKGVALDPNWVNITGKPTSYTPSAHTHSTLDLNKADVTTIGSNQNTFLALYYDTAALTGKPIAADGVGVLKLRTDTSKYGEIALTSSNKLYVRSGATLSSATWSRVCDSSDTKVTNGKGYINGTEITLVNNATTLLKYTLNEIVPYGYTGLSVDSNAWKKLWSYTSATGYYSITMILKLGTFSSNIDIVNLSWYSEKDGVVLSVSVYDLAGNGADKIAAYYKNNEILLWCCYDKYVNANIISIKSSLIPITISSFGTFYSQLHTTPTFTLPDTTYTKVSCSYFSTAKLALTANKWLTAQNFTIGNTTKSVDGSKAVSWTLAELGVKYRDIQVNGSTIDTSTGSNTTLNLKAGTNVTLANSSGAVTITAKDSWRPIQVNGNPIGSTDTLNLANGNYISITNSSGKVTVSLTNSSTTKNLALLTTGTVGAWALTTLNIDSWNSTATWVNSIKGTDTDKVINKWNEIVNFLAGISSDDTLNTLLTSKLSILALTASNDLYSLANTGLYYNTGVVATNKPNTFTVDTYAMLNINLSNSKYAKLAFSTDGKLSIYNGTTWVKALTTADASVSGNTITINGVSTTWSNTWRNIKVSGNSIASNTLNLVAGTGISLANSSGTVTITNTCSFNNKITLTLSTVNSTLPIVMGTTANATTLSDSLAKAYSSLTFNPSTKTLNTVNLTATSATITTVTGKFKYSDTGKATSNYVLTADGGVFLIDKASSVAPIEKTITMAVGTDWTDIKDFVGGSSSFLTTNGTYAVSIYIKSATGISEGYFSGLMSWYNGATTSASTDEIVLHRASSSYTNTIYLRTKEAANGKCQILIAANNTLASTTYTFKFKLLC